MAPKKKPIPGPGTSKTVTPKAKATGSKAVPPKKGASTSTKAPSKWATSKTPAKGQSKTKVNQKKVVSKEDAAAIKIQRTIRGWLAKIELQKLKKQKQEYNEMIENLQKQAWLDIIERERKENEIQRLKEEEERRRKQQELKWRKQILEAAFDGELDCIEKIITEAVEQTRKNSSLTNESLERVLGKVRRNFIECEDANGNSVLSESCAGGNVDTILFFINNNAIINQIGQFHRTPIFRAAFGGHLDAVKVLLQHGADPRITDKEGTLPEQVAAIPEITEYIQSWDITETEALLVKLEQDRENYLAEYQKLKEKEQEENEKNIMEMEAQYTNKQKILQKAYEEMNKRITEHDTCVAEGFDRPDVTLQAIHDAEEHLLVAQTEERKCREMLASLRLKIREQQAADDEEDSSLVKCHIKEMDDVLLRDVGNKIKDSKKWPLIIDSSGQAVTFLKYRDTNYLNVLDPKEMDVQTLRLALLGSIRFGKPLVLDMLELNLIDLIETRLNDIQENLYEELISKSILEDCRYQSLIREGDDKVYKKENFVDMRVKKFMFVIVSKLTTFPQNWNDIFYVVKIVTPAMS